MPTSDPSPVPGLLREGESGDTGRERQVPALPCEAVLKPSRAPVFGGAVDFPFCLSRVLTCSLG